MLSFNVNAVGDFLLWAGNGGLEIHSIDPSELYEIRMILLKYQDLPADLADVSLVWTAEKSDITEILTLDRHFDVYRTRDGRSFQNVLHK
jgi:predicted nucleic acid-binding protein